MNTPYLREQTRKEKKHDFSSLQSRKLVSFLSLLLVLPVTMFLVNYRQISAGHATSTDSARTEAESANLSGPVTTGYDANASGTSTTANYIQFGTGTNLTPTPTPTASNYGNILWRGDFETGDLSQWAGVHTGSAWQSDSSINVVTSPVRQGNYAAQFTVKTNPYGSSIDRAELSATQANTGGYDGQDWYYSWSTYLPSNPNLSTGWADWTNLMQWMDLYHQCSPPAVVLIMPGYRNNPPSANPFFAFVDQPMDNQNGCATLGPKQQFYLGDVVYDQWIDFTVHIKWSADPTVGYVELWKNGKQLIAKQNMRTLDTSGGVYQEAQLYRGDNWTGTNVVYHDNVIRHDAYSPGTTGASALTGTSNTLQTFAGTGTEQRLAVLAATDPLTNSSLSSPAGIGVVSAQSQVWVANRGNNTVSIFDHNGNLVKVLSGNGLSAPYEPTLVGNQMWVPNSGTSTISVFNLDGSAAGVGPYSGNSLAAPKGMMVVGSQVWVANDGNSTVSRFNQDGTPAGAALTGIANPRGGVVVTANGVQQVWIPSHQGSIYRLDLNGNQVAATITGNSLDNVESLGLVGSQIWAPNAAGTVSTFNPDGSVATGSPVTDSTFSDIHGIVQIGLQAWIVDTGSNAISVVAIPAGTTPTPTPTTAATPTPTAAATATPSPSSACTTMLPSGTGVATTTITIPSTGTYELWTRMMAPSSSANSYYLQVDSGCPYLVSDTIGTNSWDWVTTAPITLALAAGSHAITMVGNQTGVKVDELIFSQSCTPSGTGDACFSTPTATSTPQQQRGYPSDIKNVFVIVMENQDWSQIKGNTTSAPYINSLLTRSDASYASNYHSVTPSETANGYLHPSEPNYIWLEAGTNSFTDHTFTNDNDATSGNYTTSTNHLTTLLQHKGLSWKAYQESMPSGCPITSSGNYAAKHDPFVFFTDVSGNPPSSTNTNCSSHVVPFTQLATDAQNNTLPSYSFITPNLCDDMHDNSCTGSNDPIHQGDTWLSNNLPTIVNSQAYKNGGAVFITWDEDSGSTTNNPIGMIVLSPLAKGNGYTTTTLYSHSSFVRTVETIFGLSPLLANASSAIDLSDLFVTSGLTPTPTPSLSPTPTNTPPPAFWAQDTFQRPDQTYWGTASNGMTWGDDANSSSSFSISSNTGLIETSSAANLNAVLGLPVANAEVLMSGSMTALAGGLNSLGVVLRWSNQSNYYRAVITGNKLLIQRAVNGSLTTLKSTSFPASPNTSYTIRFNANGTALSAKAWQTGSIEPANWMITATDDTFSSGQCGIRTRQQSGTTAAITLFEVTQL